MDKRICEICHKEFQPHNPRQKVCDDDHYHPCPNCGKRVLSNRLQEQNKCCSRKCGQSLGNIARKKTLQEKYGVSNPSNLGKVFIKTCQYCGKRFTTTSPRRIYCGEDYYNCPVCGNPVKISDMQQVGKACSAKCKQIKIKRTCLEKYGSTCVVNSDHARRLTKKRNLEKYGVDHYSKTQEYKDKFKETCLQRYGVEFPLQNSELKARQIETNQQRYGGNSPSCNEEVKAKVRSTVEENYGGFTFASPILSEKVKSTNIVKYGVENPMQNDEIKLKARNTNIAKYRAPTFMESLQGYRLNNLDPTKAEKYLEFVQNPKIFIETNYTDAPTIQILCKDLGVTDTPIYYHLIKNNCRSLIPYKSSTMEYEILEFLKSILPDAAIIKNDRNVIAPLELDFYLPEYKFAIECNPTITHNSSIEDPWGCAPKSVTYHQNKSKKAHEAGIFLFHIFGYEWSYKKEIIKSMIKNKLHQTDMKIFARNTEVRKLRFKDCKTFLDMNHRQGNVPNGVRLGLYTKKTDELVSVMVFSKHRHTIGLSSDNWELSRFCNKLNTNVVGGASKLFNYFIKNWNIDKLVSFSDLAHTSGGLYDLLKFRLISLSNPGYVWVDLKTDRYLSRIACQKKNLQKLFSGEEIDIENKTERQIMLEHGYVQVFDSGTIRWEWSK